MFQAPKGEIRQDYRKIHPGTETRQVPVARIPECCVSLAQMTDLNTYVIQYRRDHDFTYSLLYFSLLIFKQLQMINDKLSFCVGWMISVHPTLTSPTNVLPLFKVRQRRRLL